MASLGTAGLESGTTASVTTCGGHVCEYRFGVSAVLAASIATATLTSGHPMCWL